MSIEPEKYRLDPYIVRFMYYFEICGCKAFAAAMAKNLALNIEQAEELILNFTKPEIIEAARFHGNIGEAKAGLDHFAKAEQTLVFSESDVLKQQLHQLGEDYLKKFGMKFLISAKNKSGTELLLALQARLQNTQVQELENAQLALYEISVKRFHEKPINKLVEKIENLRQRHKINAVSLAISVAGEVQDLGFGNNKKSAWFELASLSKTFASAFAIDYFIKREISLETSVNLLLSKTDSAFRLASDNVSLRHLMSHSALNMHYVKGCPPNGKIPTSTELLADIQVICEPGEEFHYSGGGFIVLEHIIEAIEKKPIQEITENYFPDMSFNQKNLANKDYVSGYFDDGTEVPGGRLLFPAFAAGAMGTAASVSRFLNHLTAANRSLEGTPVISHDTAVQMLHGTDRGCRDFMGCDMGLGVFLAEAGNNKLAIHQGANEGFRCLYVHCVSGPNAGNGLTVLCNADAKGVLFNAEVAQEILIELNISGIDFNRFRTNFETKNISSENLVNVGYRSLLFDAFLPTLPEEITEHGPLDPIAPYNLLTQAVIRKVSNQKFARAKNLISPYLPVFDPVLFGRQGKIMDSWESARHNPYNFDYVELELAQDSEIHFAALSTKFHDGNQAQFVRIMGRDSASGDWIELVPKQQMAGHSFIDLRLPHSEVLYSGVRIEMYPDGGLTRVGLYAELPENEKFKFAMKVCQRFPDEIPKTAKPLSLKYSADPDTIIRNKVKLPMDLCSLAFGAKLLSATNEHYSPAIQLISPYPPINMFDGLESARSRDPNNFEEVVIELAEPNVIGRIIFDFLYFVNNNPREISIDGLCDGEWIALVRKTNVKAYAGNQKEFRIKDALVYSQLKIKTFPDGGINRLHVFAD